MLIGSHHYPSFGFEPDEVSNSWRFPLATDYTLFLRSYISFITCPSQLPATTPRHALRVNFCIIS